MAVHMQQKNILKNITWSFIPVAVFLVADIWFGPLWGVAIALLFALAELAWFYRREGRIERFILFDVGLLLLFGTVSIVLDNDVFFKLKPAFLELIAVLLVGVHGFSRFPLLQYAAKRYMGEITFAPQQERLMKNMARLLFVVLAAHTALIVWSAYALSTEWWAFISGGLFYILIGLLFAGQFIYMRIKRKQLSREEHFDLVDEQGRVIGRAPRSRVHGNPNLLHSTVHIHITDSKNRLYLQKRSTQKDLYPGYWDTAVGGHVSSGETVSAALQREAREELGINTNGVQPLFRYVMRNPYESELVHTFLLKHSGPFKLNPQEIEEGRFWTRFEIEKMLGKAVFTPNFEQEFGLLKKNKII